MTDPGPHERAWRDAVDPIADRVESVAEHEKHLADWQIKDYPKVRRKLEAAEAEAKRLETENEKLQAAIEVRDFTYRFGTPFDPTGAKSGSEIMSLRNTVKLLEAENKKLKGALRLAAEGTDGMARLLADLHAKNEKFKTALEWYARQHAYIPACVMVDKGRRANQALGWLDD